MALLRARRTMVLPDDACRFTPVDLVVPRFAATSTTVAMCD
jgi:hypothetical protein